MFQEEILIRIYECLYLMDYLLSFEIRLLYLVSPLASLVTNTNDNLIHFFDRE